MIHTMGQGEGQTNEDIKLMVWGVKRRPRIGLVVPPKKILWGTHSLSLTTSLPLIPMNINLHFPQKYTVVTQHTFSSFYKHKYVSNNSLYCIRVSSYFHDWPPYES